MTTVGNGALFFAGQFGSGFSFGRYEEDYVQHLLNDLDNDVAYAQGREVQTIFIGGGTPSLLSGPAMQTLLDGVRARLPLAADAEITMEANPGTAAPVVANQTAYWVRWSVDTRKDAADSVQWPGVDRQAPLPVIDPAAHASNQG